MRQRSVQTRAAKLTAAAVLAGALGGFGISAAEASFTLDVRLAGGGKSVTATAGQTINLEVWGQVIGTGTSTLDGLQDAFFGVTSTPGSGGTVGDLGALSLANPFNGTTTVSGTTYTTGYTGTVQASANGQYIGSTDTSGTTAAGWVFARDSAGTDTSGTSIASGQGQEFLLATLQYQVTTLGSASSHTSINATARPIPAGSTLVVPAVWQEDGAEVDGIPSLGAAVDITVNSGVVHHPGDVDDNGIVDQNDLNIINGAWQASVATWEQGDLDGNGIVDQNDLNLVNGNWQNTYSPAPAGIAFAAVPEPTTIGLILGAPLLMLKRQRRQA